jgi:hypothetical protein
VRYFRCPRYWVGVAVTVLVLVGVSVIVGVAVTVAVGGMVVDVNVAVGGCELRRVMRGLTHSAKSSWEEPLV